MEKHFAVIGHPIAHSLSPQMHEAGYKALGLKADYRRFDVHPDQLGNAVLGLKALGFAGWNVTLPHKEAIIPFLDDLSLEAQRIGAVNTVKREGDRLIGHNTDGGGFVRAVEGLLEGFRGKRAVILGAGGAARGIAFALAEEGMRLEIRNRTPAKAKKLAEDLADLAAEVSWGGLEEGAWLKEVDLVVQTTSVGLHHEAYPLSLRGIAKETLVVDIIFNPWETFFLKEAKELGCRTLNGLDMLLYQGALAWEFWFGKEAPVEVMREALVSALRE